MTEVKKESFVEKVVAYINADDSTKVEKFVAVAVKKWQKELDTNKRKIEEIKRKSSEEQTELEEYLAEAKEEYTEAFMNIDLDQLGSRDEILEFIEDNYEYRLEDASEKVEEYEEKLASLKEKSERGIKKLEKANKVLEGRLSNVK